MFIISHLSSPTTWMEKMFTQSERQFGMILIFDRVPGSRITKAFRKLFLQFSQSVKSIFLSIITCFLKSGLRRETVLPGLGKKECRGASGGWLARWLPLWQSCLPKIYHSSNWNHNFQCLPLFQIIMYKDCACTAKFDSQALVLEGCKVHFHCTGHQH